jgi:phage protein U
MMLAQLGPVTFEVWPVNMHEHQHDAEATYAEKAVMGRRPPLEFVGEGPDTRSLYGTLWPVKFGGSMGDFHAMRQSGKPQPLMLGNGTPLGWYVIERVNETGRFLTADGTAQKIDFYLNLKMDDPAGGGDLFAVLFGLIG